MTETAGRAQGHGSGIASPQDISVGVLSYGTHRTLERSVSTHVAAGLTGLVGEYFIHFNALSDADRAVAASLGVAFSGSPQNTGIYGGFRAIAERADRRFVLVLENDISAITDPATTAACLASAVADMAAHAIPIFGMASRTTPGTSSSTRKLVRANGIKSPLRADHRASKPTLAGKIASLLRHGRLDIFRGAAVFVERDPEIAYPMAWRKLASGNYVTSSRHRNWSNQAVLFDRRFFLDVVCRRVDEQPDDRLVNGHQDIERALNRSWWRRLGVPMGHSGIGIFRHARIVGDEVVGGEPTAELGPPLPS